MPIIEEMFFFQGSKSRSLLGFSYLPKTPQKTGIVLCHAFADEQNLSLPVMVRTSREMALLGFPVLRFDMSGCGDSDGNLEDVTVADWLVDLTAAIEILKERAKIEHYFLWGLRLGAGIALLHNSQFPNSSSLILWQPVIDFSLYFKQFLRRIIAQNITADSNPYHSVSEILIDLEKHNFVIALGYPISKKLYDSFCNIRFKSLLDGITNDVLLLSISMSPNPSSQIKSLAGNSQNHQSRWHFQHIIAEPFWDRYWRMECKEATNTTLNWLRIIK